MGQLLPRLARFGPATACHSPKPSHARPFDQLETFTTAVPSLPRQRQAARAAKRKRMRRRSPPPVAAIPILPIPSCPVLSVARYRSIVQAPVSAEEAQELRAERRPVHDTRTRPHAGRRHRQVALARTVSCPPLHIPPLAPLIFVSSVVSRAWHPRPQTLLQATRKLASSPSFFCIHPPADLDCSGPLGADEDDVLTIPSPYLDHYG